MSSTFTEVWNQLDKARGIADSGKIISMTPEQFKNMLQQFYDVGHKHGYKEGHARGLKSAKELQDIVNENTGGPFGGSPDMGIFNDFFGGGTK